MLGDKIGTDVGAGGGVVQARIRGGGGDGRSCGLFVRLVPILTVVSTQLNLAQFPTMKITSMGSTPIGLLSISFINLP